MPKLTKKHQKAAAAADIPGDGFSLLEPGKYIATLSKVEAKTSQAGNPVWNAEFTDITNLDGDTFPGRQWLNLNLPIDTMPDTYRPDDTDEVREKKWAQYQALSAGRLHGFFEAFGFTVDSDTDEMIGEKALLTIGVGTIQRGPKAGQETNQVNNIEPLPDDFDGEGDGDDDEF